MCVCVLCLWCVCVVCDVCIMVCVSVCVYMWCMCDSSMCGDLRTTPRRWLSLSTVDSRDQTQVTNLDIPGDISQYYSPLETGSHYVSLVALDSCSFCLKPLSNWDHRGMINVHIYHVCRECPLSLLLLLLNFLKSVSHINPRHSLQNSIRNSSKDFDWNGMELTDRRTGRV